MSFYYIFECDECKKRSEPVKIEFTFAEERIFVKDDSWEEYPKGWLFRGKLKCGDCLKK